MGTCQKHLGGKLIVSNFEKADEIFLLVSTVYIKEIPVEPHEAVPEVSKGKVHITQNKHVPIEWFVTTASQSRI